MKAKIFFSLVIFIIFNTSATSQMVQKTNHRIEKTIIKTQKLMYANAKSGLIIRKEPSVNSDKIGKFNYSDQVLIIKKTQINFSITDDGKRISGNWLKVSGIKNNQLVGFVFSGFLTEKKIEPPIRIDLITEWPPEIEGCCCYYSLNKKDLEFKNRYVYVASMGYTDLSKNIALIKINDTIRTLKPVKENYWKNNDFELFSETKLVKRNGYETWLRKGKLVIKSKDGVLLEVNIDGKCGC